jgi:hypothetical protein
VKLEDLFGRLQDALNRSTIKNKISQISLNFKIKLLLNVFGLPELIVIHIILT